MVLHERRETSFLTPCLDAMGRDNNIAVRPKSRGRISVIARPGESATMDAVKVRRFIEALHRALALSESG